MSPPRPLEVEDAGDTTVATFIQGVLDDQNTEMMGEDLFKLADGLGRRMLVLDFSNVEYLSSTALGKFITLNKKVKAGGGQLVFRNMDPQIYEVFDVTKLNKLFRIEHEPAASPPSPPASP